MKKPSTSTLLATAGIMIGVAGAGLGLAHADTSTTTAQTQTGSARTNPMQQLIAVIAQKFNLQTADVQAVFDEQHKQMEAEHKQAETDRINGLVTSGTLTQDQANKIIAKRAELETEREAHKTSFQNITETERRTAMQTERDALQKWATENNVPLQYLLGGGHGRHGGPGFDGPRGAQFSNQPVNN